MLVSDGEEEIMTLKPFHVNMINIYKLKDNKYEVDYTYPNVIDFTHALVDTTLCGKPCFAAGICRIDCECFVLTWEDDPCKVHIVDQAGGPANLDVVHHQSKEYILAANHTRNKAAFYEVTE